MVDSLFVSTMAFIIIILYIAFLFIFMGAHMEDSGMQFRGSHACMHDACMLLPVVTTGLQMTWQTACFINTGGLGFI